MSLRRALREVAWRNGGDILSHHKRLPAVAGVNAWGKEHVVMPVQP